MDADQKLFLNGHCIPLNQPGKPEYDRAMGQQNVCVTVDEYAALQKSYREIMLRCGDRCQ